MSLMSWGALSISALLGAELADLPPSVLADAILYSSGPVAAVLPLFCLPFVQGSTWRDVVYAIFAGAVLVMGIALASHWIGVEVGGVGGGLAVIVFSVMFASSKGGFAKALSAPSILPYGLLIIGVVLQKLIVPQLAAIGVAPSIETERVSFQMLGSPGIALFLVTIISIALRPSKSRVAESFSLLRHVAKRSWPALASILLFLMAARLLVEIGSIQALAGLLSQLGLYPAIVFVAILGGIGSYVTGSGVASNALFMPSAAATGESFDALALFASLQHSAAAHVGVASLPIIAILLAALPDRKATDERSAMRTGISLALVWLLFVMASGAVQTAVIR
jgi:lactate permease